MNIDLFSTSLKMLFALVVILGGLLIVFYLTRGISKRDGGRSKERLIRVLGNTYIGVKKSISLVEVPGAILVLGVSSDNICLLTKIENKEILEKFKRNNGEKISPPFSAQLREFSSMFKKDKK